jgi:hypothetical protein
MTAVNNGLTPAQTQSLILSMLQQHRNALTLAQNIYKWSSGLAVADFATATGLSTSDAQVYMSAIADANAEANTHYTGTPGGSYPAPSSDYIYAATQAEVLGPQ